MRADDLRAAVRDQEAEVAGNQAVVDRHQHRADLRDGVERLELGVRVWRDIGHPVALPDPKRCSDRLSKLKHKLARRNITRRKTMTRRNLAENLDHRFIREQQLETRGRRRLDHSDVVFRIDNDRELAQ